MARILVIEDNPDLAFGLRTSLEIEGHVVDVAGDGVSGLARLRTEAPELLILDLMLPELDGYGVLRALRGEGYQLPVLILTARSEEADKVFGFRLGADDFVTKPCGVLELAARVDALLRRAPTASRVPAAATAGAAGAAGFAAAAGGTMRRFGDVEVNVSARTVTRDGAPVRMSPKEFDLLLALLRRDGAVAGRLELLQEVWGYDDSVVSRTVDTHVASLRGKLEEDPASPRHILTVWKTGYRLQP